MTTKYIEDLTSFEVCMWINEHPNAKIISICNSGRLYRYSIFYQE